MSFLRVFRFSLPAIISLMSRINVSSLLLMGNDTTGPFKAAASYALLCTHLIYCTIHGGSIYCKASTSIGEHRRNTPQATQVKCLVEISINWIIFGPQDVINFLVLLKTPRYELVSLIMLSRNMYPMNRFTAEPQCVIRNRFSANKIVLRTASTCNLEHRLYA
jgi:hypothetical protein